MTTRSPLECPGDQGPLRQRRGPRCLASRSSTVPWQPNLMWVAASPASWPTRQGALLCQPGLLASASPHGRCRVEFEPPAHGSFPPNQRGDPYASLPSSFARPSAISFSRCAPNSPGKRIPTLRAHPDRGGRGLPSALVRRCPRWAITICRYIPRL